ncbi:hypothetical protein NKI46_09420 [Mesorhizobium sp. M0615]|uniref:hypothetical protein n=1 Tax=Mesorhizobium sp. M0615 TaxID=2956971 RepID=UPI003339B9A5
MPVSSSSYCDVSFRYVWRGATEHQPTVLPSIWAKIPTGVPASTSANMARFNSAC